MISDGGSTDGTLTFCRTSNLTVLTGKTGRGRQLANAANTTGGNWLLFIHADTVLDETAEEAIDQFINSTDAHMRAGYFRFKLDDNMPEARQLERRVAWRCKKFSLPYGDQGLLIHRDFYRTVGGFRNLPLMEDVDLVWRIQKARGKTALAELSANAVTSSEKFRNEGYFIRSARNLFCLFLFWIKVPPALIVRIY